MSNNLDRSKSTILNYLEYCVPIIMPCCNMKFYEEIVSLGNLSELLQILKPTSVEDSILERLKNANNSIKTPYFVIGSDDDMLMKQGLVEGVKFLDKNTDYSNYYGLTARMLLKIPYFPLITFAYQNKPRNHGENNFINTFKSYRSYPLIYGINRLKVLSFFIKLFPNYKSNWEGIWELNFALSVSISGKAYYCENKPYLLRLIHKSSRTSYQDFPELPSYNDNAEKYIEKYVNVNYLIETIKKECNLSIKETIILLFVDIVSDCIHRESYPKVPVVEINMGRILILNFSTNVKSFLKKPENLLRWYSFVMAALHYSKNRYRTPGY